jgi:hypothetical protein
MMCWVATGVVVTLMRMEFGSHPFDPPHIHSDVQVDDVVNVSSIGVSGNVTAGVLGGSLEYPRRK